MIHAERQQGRIHLSLDAYYVGSDIIVIIQGGDRPHLGTITAGARLEPLRTVQFQTHKEFYITEEIAVMLRKEFPGNFLICCGAHLDDITKEEVKLLTELSVQLGLELIEKLKSISIEEQLALSRGNSTFLRR